MVIGVFFVIILIMFQGPPQIPSTPETATPFTLDELKKRYEEISTEAIDSYPNGGWERVQVQQALIKSWLDSLISQKEKFDKVFKTEKGSTYFILQTGESFRIKKQEQTTWQGEYTVEPIATKTFFITLEEYELMRVMEEKHGFGNLIGE